jgi:ABC-type lipoprotein release transport system permease subunit
MMNSLVAGVMEESLQTSIRLQTGHVQVRAESYSEEKVSLKWEDLLQDAETVAAQAQALPGVQAAAPVLWANGVINTPDDSSGVRVYGIDTGSAVFDPVRNGVTAGAFLAADDRSGVLLGQRLAESLKLAVGDNVSLTVIDADGQPQEGVFTLRGVFTTGAVTYDSSSVFLPLAKAQALTNTAGRASAVIVLANSQDDAQPIADALRSPGVQTLTWRDLNQLYIDSLELVNSFYSILDFIIILIVAVIIANTLLMAVFERIRWG